MPEPTTLTVAKEESVAIESVPNWSITNLTSDSALGRSVRLTVKLMSVVRSLLAFCSMVSTLIPTLANGSNRAAATPGWSGTERTVIFATLVFRAMPVTLILFSI